MTKQEAEALHKLSSHNRELLMSSRSCGCFYCFATFPAHEIREWVDDDQTALCPYCGVDTVIGSAGGVVINESLLRWMYKHWMTPIDETT